MRGGDEGREEREGRHDFRYREGEVRSRVWSRVSKGGGGYYREDWIR